MRPLNNFTTISLLIILLIIHGVNTMHGETGSDVRWMEFVVSIWYFHEHRCSGSILDRTHILTTGRCVNDLPVSVLSIAAGIVLSTPRKIQLVPVKEIHFHPRFRAVCRPNGLHWENDIAVLELSEELNWELTISAIPLVDRDYAGNPCDLCWLLGWDDATVDGVKLLTLHWSHARIMEDEECHNWDIHLSENERCLQHRFETTFLDEGDYGAPVFCGDSAVGMIISGGENRDNPLVQLSIYPYLRFIANILHVDEINVPSGNFQHYVAIFYDGFYICGGSIVDSFHILTAAHCVDERASASLIVIHGHSEFRTGEIPSLQSSTVRRIQIHLDFLHIPRVRDEWTILRNDIAVLTLGTPLVWSATVNTIPLSGTLTFGKTCQVYRWSRTTTMQRGTLLKSMWSSATIVDPDTCRGINPSLESNKFCTVNPYSLPIATKGDSGSPIICDGFLVGILSSHTHGMRLEYGPIQAIFFTAILPYLEFINDAVAVIIP